MDSPQRFLLMWQVWLRDWSHHHHPIHHHHHHLCQLLTHLNVFWSWKVLSALVILNFPFLLRLQQWRGYFLTLILGKLYSKWHYCKREQRAMLLMMSWREAGEIKAYLCQGLAEGASPREPLQRRLLHSLLSVTVPRHDRQSSLVMSSALDSFCTLLLSTS